VLTGPALADLTTLRVGGPARELVHATTEQRLLDAVRAADASGTPLLLLAGGSNLVVGDAGFDGTVVRSRPRDRRLGRRRRAAAAASRRVAAGRAVGRRSSSTPSQAAGSGRGAVRHPGSVGATPVQNVGAYGQEVADTIASVRTWDRVDGRQRTFAAADCGFGYRTSRFKQDPRATSCSSVTFQLRTGDLSTPVRYAELARTLGVEAGDRAPMTEVRDAVLGCARQGHGARRGGPRHLERRLVLHQPVLDRRRAGCPRTPRAGRRPTARQDQRRLAHRALGFGKGYGTTRRRCPASTRSR
jgi:UDP-N-acetylmuramate dehydrogenase